MLVLGVCYSYGLVTMLFSHVLLCVLVASFSCFIVLLFVDVLFYSGLALLRRQRVVIRQGAVARRLGKTRGLAKHCALCLRTESSGT